MIEQQNKLIDALYDKSTISQNKKHLEIIERTLDFKVVVIVDFENYQGIPTDLLDKEYDITIVETKHVGTNFVDNRISMYIGYMFGKYNPKQIILVSNDIDYYEMMMDLKAHGYPFKLREPSLVIKELLRRQTDYLLGKLQTKPILTKSTSNKTEPKKYEMDQIMKKLIKLNNGKNIIGFSRMKGYLKSNMKFSRREVQKILNTIQQIPDKIEEKCNQSSKLAYKIHDKPEIKLDTSIQNYLDKISNVTLEQD